MTQKLIKYRPSPTLEIFHASKAFFKGIRGPVGSGKSVGCCMEILKNACEQEPYNDVRKIKAGVIRNTYGELKTTTIATWLDWFEDVTHMVYGHPITGQVEFYLKDGTKVEFELIFAPQDRPKDIKRLLSLDLTIIWANEGKEVPYQSILQSKKRVDRYPKKINGGSTYPCVIADTNSCDIDCWWYNLAENEKPENHLFLSQPPALLIRQEGKKYIYTPNPEAENIENHTQGFEYYLRQIPGSVKEDIEVFVLNQYGSSEPGNKVYAAYSKDNHADIEFNPGLDIHWTHDFNYTPLSSAILQIHGDNNVFAVDEIIIKHADPVHAAVEFCERYQEYKHCKVYIYGDASGRAGEKHGQQSNYIKIHDYLTRNGFSVIMQVPKGNPAIRDGQNAVRAKVCDAEGTRTFFVNPQKCKTIDEGMMTLKTKEGSTFLEDERIESQHVLSAIRYMFHIKYPVRMKK